MSCTCSEHIFCCVQNSQPIKVRYKWSAFYFAIHEKMVSLSQVHVQDKTVNGETHQFLLLFHHKLITEPLNYFKSYQEFLFSMDVNKYSVMRYFDDSFKIENNFTFMIEYPEHKCFVFFQQEKNPMITESNADVGYLFVNNTCDENIEFKGLTKSNGNAYLDGANDVEHQHYWSYAIGQTGNTAGYNQIPGFRKEVTQKIMEVNFWVKLKNLSLLERFITTITCRGKMYFRTHLSCLLYSFFFS